MATSKSFCIRLDKKNEDDQERFAEWLRSQGSAIGCYEYHNGNHHFHAWLLSQKKIETLRASLKLKFPTHKGNGSYSIKSDDGNLNYICKGPEAPDKKSDPIIFVNTMFDPSYDSNFSKINNAHESYWRDLKEFNAKKEKKVKKEPISNFQAAMDYCKSNGINGSSCGWTIAYQLIEYYRVKVKCEPNDFQLKLMAKSVQKHLVYEEAKARDKMHVYENLLKERAKQIIGNEWVHPSW